MKIFGILFLTIILSFSAFAQTANKTGQKAENFTATSISGDKFDLADMKGKVVVLTFWGTSCPICVSEIPDLNKIAAKYKNKDVIFLAVSAENEGSIKKFIRKKPFDFNLISNGFELMSKFAEKSANGYFIMPTPTYFVINHEAVIELKISGRDKSNKLEDTLTRLLKEKT